MLTSIRICDICRDHSNDRLGFDQWDIDNPELAYEHLQCDSCLETLRVMAQEAR